MLKQQIQQIYNSKFIIILMKINTLPQILLQDIQKIYPSHNIQKYSQKYSQYIKINDQRQEIIEKQKSQTNNKYIKCYTEQAIPIIPNRVFNHQLRSTYKNLIKLNKLQNQRMSMMTKALTLKLKSVPLKKINSIKLYHNDEHIDEKMLQNQKIIDEIQNQANHKKQQTKVLKQQQKPCRFIKKQKPNNEVLIARNKINKHFFGNLSRKQNQLASYPSLPKIKRQSIIKDGDSLVKINVYYHHQFSKNQWLKKTEKIKQQLKQVQIFKSYDALLFNKKHQKILGEK